MALGGPRFAKQPLESVDDRSFAGRLQGLAKEQKARGVIGDGERIAMTAVAKLELALEIGAPQVIWRLSGRKGGSA
jgi:hypothetical protein